MKLEEIYAVVEEVPHMSIDQAKAITEVINENGFSDILELGFCHGVSTCYMAAALSNSAKGHVTTIDLVSASTMQPNIESLLAKLNLRQYVTIYYEETSYIWRLIKLIEANDEPQFDFCYIDGAHDLFVDGLAFFLVDKLLKPGGMIVFDDLNWTFESSPALKNTARVKNMPLEEKSTPQVKMVYDLLVKQHPNYIDFKVKDGWGYAKKSSNQTNQNQIVQEVVYREKHIGLGHAFLQILRTIFRK